MPVIALALKSLWNRRTTAALTITAIAISVTLLLGVQQLRTAAREGFASTISGAEKQRHADGNGRDSECGRGAPVP